MSSPTYLVRNRHNTYYFRYVIPAQYRDLLGKREIRRSLGTHRRKEAIKMARYWAVQLELALSCLHSQKMDYAEIKQLLEPTLQGLPDTLMTRFMQDGPHTSIG